jgi:predicted dehydrogenase
LLVLKPETVFGTQANSSLELGVIGYGGRGSWIAGLFREHTLTRVVAVADAFADRLSEARGKLGVEPPRLYQGLDGYRELVASKLDAVAIESPPYFHPEQAAAAVAAGKHVYMAKPVAVDVAGCKSILASAAKAGGRLSFFVDFQMRATDAFRGLMRRVHEGAIGGPVLGHVFYHTGRLEPRHKPGMPPVEARLRNWVFDKALSGDIIVEQNIHVIDVANWYLNAHPVKAYGTGGRKARVDVGDCWDHFLVTYWYPNDVRVDFSSAQFLKGFHDMCMRVYGTAGTAECHYNGAVSITGDNRWTGAEKDDTGTGGTVSNVKSFVESIRTGRRLHNAEASVDSNLTAVLGRMAAYGERAVTWDDMMRTDEKLDAKLAL